MKIAVREKGKAGRKWNKIADSSYEDEAHLQDLLYKTPDLIPIEDLGEDEVPLKVCIKEAGLPGSGNPDLIGLDERGRIAIIECKLATNPDVKRKVIGQILEYAAYLWRMSYDDFDEIVVNREGEHLVDLMRRRVVDEATEGEWSEDSFREAVAAALRDGNFRLIIAIDALNDELRRTIQYLNSRGPASFEIYALEVKFFADEAVELLVPRLFGIVTKPPLPKRRKWDEEQFFRKAMEDNREDIVASMQELYKFAEAEADQTWWGTGKQTGSFAFHLIRQDRVISVFTVYTSGSLMLSFGQMKDRVPVDTLKRFVAKLREIPGLRDLKEDFSKWPSYKIAKVLATPSDIEKFKESVLFLKSEIDKLE